MWCICGVFFQKWINQANKRLFDSYRVSKNGKWPSFGVKIDDQNIGSLKNFAFLMWRISAAAQTKLIHISISQFQHENKAILYFWTPCMAKIAFYQLGLSILKKQASQIYSITKTKLIRRPNILIISIYFNFCTKIKPFCILWTPCMANISFYQLGLYIFEKRHHITKVKLFRGPNILIISLYLKFRTKIRPY